MIDKCEAIAKMAARDNLERVNNQSKSVVPKNSFYSKYVKRIIDLVVVLPIFLILLPINLVIGIITFFISLIGVKIGNKFGNKYQNKAEFTGGLILILIGLKILLEHLGILVL